MSLFISFKYSKKKSLKKGITNQLLFWTDSPDFKLSICFHYYFLFACFLTKNIAQILPGVTKKKIIKLHFFSSLCIISPLSDHYSPLVMCDPTVLAHLTKTQQYIRGIY